jgi:beta-glucosidase
MPGPARWRTAAAELAVTTRKVSLQTLNDRVRSVLEFVKRANELKVAKAEGVRDLPEDRALNRELAAASTVLLKNDQGILPLPQEINQIALIGPNMKYAAFCGGGSASLAPYYTVSPYEGIRNALPEDAIVKYEVGCYNHALLPTLVSEWTRPGGQKGAVMRFYNKPHNVKDREVIDEVNIVTSEFQLMDYRHPQLQALYWATVEATYTAPATGVYDFGLTVFGSGNLYIDGNLVVENTERQRPGSTFFGKGTAEEKGQIDMIEGQMYSLRLDYASSPTSKIAQPGVSFPGGAGRIGCACRINEDESIARAAKLAAENKYTILCAGLNVSRHSLQVDVINLIL